MSKKKSQDLDQLASDHAEWDKGGNLGSSPETAKAADEEYWETIMASGQGKQITMRLPDQLLKDIKKMAKDKDYTSYQKFIRNLLIKVVSEHKDDNA